MVKFIINLQSRTMRNYNPIRQHSVVVLHHCHLPTQIGHTVHIESSETIYNLSLGWYINSLLLLMFHEIFVLSFEFDGWIHNNYLVVCFESVSAVWIFERSYNVSDIFIFSKESLILTSALNRGSTADK
jgi:hypothetical protein